MNINFYQLKFFFLYYFYCYCNRCNYYSMNLNSFSMLCDKNYIKVHWNQSSRFGIDNCFHLVFCNYPSYIKCSFEDRFLLHNHHNCNDNFTFGRQYLSLKIFFWKLINNNFLFIFYIHQHISKCMGMRVRSSL